MKIKPFSALSYILHNRARVLVLILMMSFITVSFIGGMYVDNTGEIFRVSFPESDRYMIMMPKGASYDAIEEYRQAQEDLPNMLPPEAQEILYVNVNYGSFESLMSFTCQTEGIFFQSVEDFELFKERTGLVPEEIHLNNCEIVMTEQMAKNRDLSVGDPINKDSIIKLAATYDAPGMRFYGVAEVPTGETLVLSSDGVCDEKLHEDLRRVANELKTKYPHVYFSTTSIYLDDVEEDMVFFYYIFAAILAVVAIVLLVTINAAFTAAYDKRKHEFAIYKALGFSGFQIFRKIASEVLIMNLFALLLGAVLNAGIILVLNECLWSSGQRFWRVSSMAVVGTVAMELLVNVTIILLNWKKVRKCEVTEG